MISEHDFRRPDLEERLSGVAVPVITPFLNSQIDANSMNRLVDYLVRAGVQGLFFLGHTGEFEHLSAAQKKQVMDITTRLEVGKSKVFIGTTGETIEETIELTKYARQKGANAVVISPQYNTAMTSFDYLKKVLDETSVPVILYNNPGITGGKYIDINDLRKLFENPRYKSRIIGIKDSSGNDKYFSELIDLRNKSHPRMAVFQGSESAMLNTPLIKDEQLRFDGIVPGSANYDPKLLINIYGRLKKGRMPAGSGRLRDYITEYDRDGNPIAVIKKRLALGFKISRTPPGSRVNLGYDDITPKIIASAELVPRKAA
ncbi:dihydrodipicolinate synthase family protein [Candidatus Woesearchaeota archaeon]|nr:dihydrodipicolinate synthase family protein [Candidatus Woesearchaeota archaeon]